MAGALHLELLGGLHVTLEGTPVTGFVSSKAPALLCYLAVSRRPHFRSVLATLLWGDLSEVDAAANLRQVLANLRRLLDPYLIITRQTVAFNHHRPYWLDVEQFELNITSGLSVRDLQHLRAAIVLYRGDFLYGFAVRDAPAFEEWALAEQDRLRERAVEALHVLAAQHAARGEYTIAINDTRHLLALDSWREEAHRHMMLLLARSGQRSAALVQYETCRRVLQQELGVEPAEETTALYRRILAMGTARRNFLPTSSMLFVGREDELANLDRWMTDPECRLMTIVGPGGIGKTRLAMEAAKNARTRFLEGVYFVSLSAVTSAASLVSTIAHTLQLRFLGGEDAATQLPTYLREKELLLVLDNFEHLVDAGADLLVEILRQAPEVKLLVTSRERLRLQTEWLLALEGLELPPNASTGRFEEYSAVRLFVQGARRVNARFQLSDTEKPHVLRVCRLLGGLPLGIELATTWLRVLSCAELALEVERGIDLLAVSLQDMPKRQQSLRAVFDHSWNMLTNEEQRVFRALTVFHGGFCREAAEQVVDASLRLLSALVDKSLLRRRRSGRYDMHEAVWQYAAAELHGMPSEATLARDRHADYFISFLQRWETPLVWEKPKAATEMISEEFENLWAAWNWVLERGRTETTGLSLNSLRLVYEVRARFQEGEEAFGRVVAMLRGMLDLPGTHGDEHRKLLCTALARQGLFCIRLGRNSKAKSLLQEGLALAIQLGASAEIDFCGSNLGNVALHLGQYHEAQQLYRESLRLKHERGDTSGIAVPLNNLGYVAYLMGEYADATQHLEQSLALCRRFGDRWGLVFALNNLAEVAAALGNYAEARQLIEESLALCDDLGDQMGKAEALNSLGNLAFALGQYTEAQHMVKESLTLAEAIGDRWRVAVALANLGKVADAVGELDAAYRQCCEALKIAMSIQAAPLALSALIGIAAHEMQRSRPQQAAELLAFIVSHPATSQVDRVRAEHLLATLACELAPDVLAAVQEWGTARKLDEFARFYAVAPAGVPSCDTRFQPAVLGAKSVDYF